MGLYINHVNVVLSKLREAPITELSTDTTTEAYRAQIAVRRAVWRIWNAKQWGFRMRRTTLALSSGTASYNLPKYVGEPSVIFNSLDHRLTNLTLHQFKKWLQGSTASGEPLYYVLFEMQGISAQVASATTLSISSSSALDVSQKVLIKGIVSGEVDMEEVSLSGTATVSTTKTFSSVLAISKSAETAGRITVLGGATTIGILGPSESSIRNRAVLFYPTPDATYTLTIHSFGLPPLLTNAYEDTEIPYRWDYVVEQFALAFALQAKGQEQLAEANAQLDIAVKFLETDMATEEYISTEDAILPERWGGTSDYWWLPTMSGFGTTF